jgi:hypothetical protein
MGRYGVTVSKSRSFAVRRGLSRAEQESVALGIFLDVSHRFEQMQAGGLWAIATDSGYSAEDLVSNLVGFYRAVRPVGCGNGSRDRFETVNAQTPRKTSHHPGPEDKASQQHPHPDEICKTSIPGSNPGGASKLSSANSSILRFLTTAAPSAIVLECSRIQLQGPRELAVSY